jgi:hypothetical protein
MPYADPTRESPCGLPCRVDSAQKKETPGEAPGVEVGVARQARAKEKYVSHLGEG